VPHFDAVVGADGGSTQVAFQGIPEAEDRAFSFFILDRVRTLSKISTRR